VAPFNNARRGPDKCFEEDETVLVLVQLRAGCVSDVTQAQGLYVRALY